MDHILVKKKCLTKYLWGIHFVFYTNDQNKVKRPLNDYIKYIFILFYFIVFRYKGSK